MQENAPISKIVISTSEVQSVALQTDPLMPAKLPPAIPLWARLLMLPLVLTLPLLAIVALVMRLALRASAPRTQQAWHSYMMSLLIAAAFIFTVSAVLLFSYMPAPPQSISAGLSDLDERTTFAPLPSASTLSGVQIAQELKPLVMVASPAAKRWFSRREVASNSVGAALLLQANASGYLFATAGHVASAAKGAKGQRVLLTTGSFGWAPADVVAYHRTADLALLWLPRHSGSADFVQPLAQPDQVQDGVNVYVIGHPQGLNYTMSSGMISRIAGDVVQISAPVSPGNSGGPVYDDHGRLIGVVIAKFDRSIAPNAENLNFAASAALLRQTAGWEFVSEGQQRLTDYLNALNAKSAVQTKAE